MARGKIPKFDVLVIGAGPGGMAAATRGTLKGLKVGLVNGHRIWGYGIHGAYKSKGLYELAKDHLVATKPDRGYQPVTSRIDFKQVHDQLIDGAKELEGLYRDQIAMLGITEIKGMAAFVDRHTVEVEGRRYRGKHIIIATGTRPHRLPGIDRDSPLIMSSDEIVSLTEFPQSLVIVGAGVIGCEFASIFNTFGSRVTLVDNKPAILSHEDDDVTAFLTRNFEQNGIEVIQSARLDRIVAGEEEVTIRLQDGRELQSKIVLISVGREACADQLGLQHTGVEINAEGYIAIDEYCRTNVPQIYAVGDVAKMPASLDLSLVHVAEADGHQAIHHILGGSDPLPMDHIPFIIFTIPMIAGAGDNEKTAREKYGAVRIACLDNVRNHRAHAMRSFTGFVKLIVGPEGDDRILGVRACGPQADSLIGEVSLCIQHNLPYTDLMDAVHAHPSLSESLHNAARMLAGLYPVGSLGK